MKELGMLATSTLRSDRLKKCPSPTNNELQKEGAVNSDVMATLV
jgi:hypothetical protein